MKLLKNKAMNTKHFFKIIFFSILICTNVACGQKPEQQKAIENAKKQADSMLNDPQIKEMMEYAEQFKPKPGETTEEPKENPSKDRRVKSPLDFFSITKTNEKKFDAWQFGSANIVLVTLPYKRGNKQEIPVGKINENGSFSFDLPTVNPDRELKHFYKCDNPNNNASYTNENVLAVPCFLSIRQNGEEIGMLSMATSKQIAYNNSPRGKYRGDKGYRIDLLFVMEQAGLKNNCSREITATDHAEITKKITISDIYELQFKSGWNMIKVEVLDKQLVGNIPYYKTKHYTTIQKLPQDVRWVFNKF